MILSHSSTAWVSASARITIHLGKTTHRLKEVDLGTRQVTQHLLHLGFLRVLEDRLLP